MTLDTGNREMAGLRSQQGLQPTVSNNDKDLPNLPYQPQQTYHPNSPSNFTALPPVEGQDRDSYASLQPDHYYQDPGRSLREAASYETATTSMGTSEERMGGREPSPNSNGRKMRKLLKKRPG